MLSRLVLSQGNASDPSMSNWSNSGRFVNFNRGSYLTGDLGGEAFNQEQMVAAILYKVESGPAETEGNSSELESLFRWGDESFDLTWSRGAGGDKLTYWRNKIGKYLDLGESLIGWQQLTIVSEPYNQGVRSRFWVNGFQGGGNRFHSPSDYDVDGGPLLELVEYIKLSNA